MGNWAYFTPKKAELYVIILLIPGDGAHLVVIGGTRLIAKQEYSLGWQAGTLPGSEEMHWIAENVSGAQLSKGDMVVVAN